jgi:hypothetical protein
MIFDVLLALADEDNARVYVNIVASFPYNVRTRVWRLKGSDLPAKRRWEWDTVSVNRIFLALKMERVRRRFIEQLL